MAEVHPDTSSSPLSDMSSLPLQITTDLMNYQSPVSIYPLTPLSSISELSPPSFVAESPNLSVDCPLSPSESPTGSYIADDIKQELLWNGMTLVSPSPPTSTSTTDDYRRYQLPQAPPPLLPPCRICEEKASGFHYGVNTCEACKRFFRRSMARSKKYTCNAHKKCPIGKGRRDICAYCRYQRCISAGMSKQATRKGRYSYEKKTRYTMEVKGSTITTSQQDAKLMVMKDAFLRNSNCIHGSEASPPTTYSPTNEDRMHLFDSVSLSPAPGIPRDDEPNEIMRSVVDFLDISKSPALHAIEIELASTRDGWTQDQPIPNWSGDVKMIDEYETIIRQISDANRIYSPVERMVCSTPDFRAKQEEYYHQWRQSQGMFADLKPLSKDEYLDFYETTGVDLDNRRHIAKLLSSRIEQGVCRMIKFVKSIPGFKELPLDDQAELIKAFRFEWWMLSFYRGMYPEFGIGTYCSGDFYHKEELVRIYDVPEYVNSIFSFSQTLQNINMSTDESAMLKSIAIMASDRVTLKNRNLVEDIQWQLVQCFQYLLRTRYPDDRGRFARILDRLQELRSISHWNNNLSKNLTKHWPEFGGSQLLFEVFSL